MRKKKLEFTLPLDSLHQNILKDMEPIALRK